MATTETNNGLSGKYVAVQFVAETGNTKTVDKLVDPPSKDRTLWLIKMVNE